MKKAWVSLLVADAPSSRWVHHCDLFYDDDLVQQPVGQVDLYISDFVGVAGLPAKPCGPSKTDLDAGVSRGEQIVLTYERLAVIFRTTRSFHDPTSFPIMDGDKAESSTVRLDSERAELVRRMAEERAEMDRRVAEWQTQIERCMAEIERRMAEGRSCGEQSVGDPV